MFHLSSEVLQQQPGGGMPRRARALLCVGVVLRPGLVEAGRRGAGLGAPRVRLEGARRSARASRACSGRGIAPRGRRKRALSPRRGSLAAQHVRVLDDSER